MRLSPKEEAKLSSAELERRRYGVQHQCQPSGWKVHQRPV
jgi:hypothetical protein